MTSRLPTVARRGPKPRTARTARPKATDPAGWEPPGHLAGEAEAAWRHVVALLARAGNLDRTDPTLVEAYAINVDLLRAAGLALSQDGITLLNGAGVPVAHPAVATVNSATMRLKAIISDLGLCPASSKHAAGKADATPRDSRWAGFFDVVG
jgi:P27 family predicted phage terminase small subunit